MQRESFAGKQLAILGLGRTGLASLRVLARLGARLIAVDEKPAEAFGEELPDLIALTERLEFGPGALERVGEPDQVIISPGISVTRPEIVALKRRGIPVDSELELAWSLAKAPFLAVTGTNGKSTTVTLAHLCLEASGIQSRLAGNIGKAVIEDAFEAAEEEVLVTEVSNYQLEATTHFRPRWAALLNLQGDHAERQTFDEYIAAKARLFASQSPEDLAVLFWDDPKVRALAPAIKSQIAWFSVTEQLQAPGAWLEGDTLTVDLGKGPVALLDRSELRLFGAHNVANALAAALLSCSAGATLEGVRATLSSFTGLDFALRLSATVRGRRFINDSKGTNPPSTLAALSAFTEPLVVIAGGLGKGADFTELGRVLAAKARALVVIGQDGPAIAEAACAAGLAVWESATSLEEAVERAYALSQPGDTVLLSPACASQDMFRDYKQRGELFDKCVAALASREEKEAG